MPKAGPKAGSRSEHAEADSLDGLEPRIFRIRVKARSGPRTRILSLAAESEDEARRLAERDLDSTWTILEVRAA